jgi:hypothetical protein
MRTDQPPPIGERRPMVMVVLAAAIAAVMLAIAMLTWAAVGAV